jgi:hypothetical protein
MSGTKITCWLEKSDQATKKFQVSILDPRTQRVRTVHFGAKGYSDYTLHKDPERMHRYTIRHQKRENWTKSGIYTAGFWSKWILWNKPSFRASVQDTSKRFGLNIRIVRLR